MSEPTGIRHSCGSRYVPSVLCSRIRENSGGQTVSERFGPKSHDFGYACCLQFLAIDTLSRLGRAHPTGAFPDRL